MRVGHAAACAYDGERALHYLYALDAGLTAD
jgi:hypothetical protein